MRILFISPYIPSLVRVRPYNIIKHLAWRGNEITLLALVPPGEDTTSLADLKEWCRQIELVTLPRWRTLWNGVQALPGHTPFQAAYSRSPEMQALVTKTLKTTRFDVIHVEHLRGAELSPAPNGTPVVFDSVDSISLLFEKTLHAGPNWRSRLKARLDLERTRSYESHLAERYARVLVTSPQDKESLVALAGQPNANERIAVLPNGVDLAYFSPLDLPREPATLVFSGKMSYHANEAAAIDLITTVMPLIWQQLPNTQLKIVGKDPSSILLALAEDRRITVTGTVPDMRPHLAQATISVLPIRYGVGIQNKVLEAMAMETPVITTSQPMASLKAKAGQDLLVADTPGDIAAAALSLLRNEQRRHQIGTAGRRYVETHHDWNATAQNLESIYRDAAHG
ncbi:MAG: glycosyltransferase [Chloroflexi bacterium]|nr:MAG: glycosyltransferase [Chloroflexota bacterium]